MHHGEGTSRYPLWSRMRSARRRSGDQGGCEVSGLLLGIELGGAAEDRGETSGEEGIRGVLVDGNIIGSRVHSVGVAIFEEET